MTPEPATAAAPVGADTPPQAVAARAERRLHPMSWLFVLLQQLRHFVLPLVAAFFFGGDRNELWPLIGVGVLVLIAVWRYFTYRFGVGEDALVIRSGLLERRVRVIPFARIHNVALQQSMLHRLFGVAEVRLESAGGQKPEAEMRVLTLRDALALEALVRRRGAGARATSSDAPSFAADAAPLLRLSPGEVVRLGLVSNRGLIVAGAAIGGLSQFRPQVAPDLFEYWSERLLGWAIDHSDAITLDGMALYAVGIASLVAVAVLLLRLLSVALALLQYWGFTLTERDRRLTVERGLLARWRTSASRRRIQAWTLHEGVMHRLLRRRSLDVDTAVAEQNGQPRALRELAPIATPEACEALVGRLLPRAGWNGLAWLPLPSRLWWRLFLGSLPVPLVAAGVFAWKGDAWGLLVLLWLPFAAYGAVRHARNAAYAIGDELLAVRGGWWRRYWRFAELDKLQALQLTRNAMDRRCGTATLWFDTAGANPLQPALRIRFLPEAEARALFERLSHTLARRPMRW